MADVVFLVFRDTFLSLELFLGVKMLDWLEKIGLFVLSKMEFRQIMIRFLATLARHLLKLCVDVVSSR